MILPPLAFPGQSVSMRDYYINPLKSFPNQRDDGAADISEYEDYPVSESASDDETKERKERDSDQEPML